jgi:succinoglycan biosynthesis protein ExoM
VTTPTTIALCVLTYGRPLGLRNVLTGIGELDIEGLSVDVRLVVVDNDVAASGRSVVEDVAPHLPFPLVYEVEPERGIPLARNRSVAAAGDVELIGWLDDDEVPHPGWLRHLVTAYRGTGADVVIGPSVPEFPPGTPSWVSDGGFFERTRFPSGTQIPPHYARTSGVLVRRAALPAREAPFNEDLRYTGGSDRELFVEMQRAGAQFLWVDEALVVERVPASRARLRWILQRAFRIGNSRSTTLVLEGADVARRAKRVGAGLYKMLAGTVRSVLSLPRGRAGVVRGAVQCCNGAGLVSGALGFRYQEYRRHHGA